MNPVERDIVIQVRGVSKRFVMFDRREDYLKQVIVLALGKMLGPIGERWRNRKYGNEFWALRDVTFELRKGEAFGIVGHNGAGKSTLLQILAGTLSPTQGVATVKGRVAALLELGSGFNPDFTGRENVYLNCSIYGLDRQEVESRFNEILSFAEIGDFIDQPIKTYSSGMTMRLAFSVQLALHPDVLIVDEALAVGDAFFQAKCMARLRKLIDKGVTVLFVTHDMATVSQFCSSALLLDHGKIKLLGSPKQVIDEYFMADFERRNASAVGNVPRVGTVSATSSLPSSAPGGWRQLIQKSSEFEKRAAYSRAGNGDARFESVEIFVDGLPKRLIDFGDIVVLRQLVRVYRPLAELIASWRIKTPQGVEVIYNDLRLRGKPGWEKIAYKAGEVVVFEWKFKLDLLHGTYVLAAGLGQAPRLPGDDWTFIDMVPLCLEFTVAPRKEGMIAGLVTIDADSQILCFPS